METERKADPHQLRSLPSIDELLRLLSTHSTALEAGPVRIAEVARQAVDSIRREILAGTFANDDVAGEAVSRVHDQWHRSQLARIKRVINATGVIVHTNLGRAPLSEAARTAISEASGYCTVEYDLEAGGRGHRGEYVEELVTRVTGAEAAIVVNNCAAAAFMVLTVFAAGGEVIISRGELVEIGGDFRVPDVLKASGAVLCEVGTTNRTKITDYEKACSENTRMILRVHPSNYRIVGFTASPSITSLAELAEKKALVLFEDIGSGALLGLGDEPVPAKSLADGAHIVAFSGDKLLGGPQSGIIAGRRDLIEAIRMHPLYRVLRVGKLIYAGLGATLESFARGTAESEIPVLKMIGQSSDQIELRASKFVDTVRSTGCKIQLKIIGGNSVIGGGSAPDIHPVTALITLDHPEMSADAIERALRRSSTPIITRIEDDKVLIDLRTVTVGDEELLLRAIADIG